MTKLPFFFASLGAHYVYYVKCAIHGRQILSSLASYPAQILKFHAFWQCH